MEQERKSYEAPTMTVYRFENGDQALTASGDVDVQLTAGYAANALNTFMGGTNTTIE